MISIKTFIHNFFRLFGLKIGRTIPSFGNKLAIYNIPKEDYNISGNTIYFKLLKLEIPVLKAAPILERYQNAIQLYKKGGFKFFLDEEGELHAKNNNMQLRINDEEELFILSEVFLEGAYNLISPTQKKIALVDIGMNVGITSLFYASKKNVDKIFSFEPFGPTYSMAINNIKLNPSFSNKIQANNFGLAKSCAEIVVPFSLKEKGRMGLNGLPKLEGYVTDKIYQQKVQIKQANQEILKIKEQVKENFVVCKIDTEGAEYEIIDSFYDAGLLSFANVYFIEWHHKNPEGIVSKLETSNYTVIETSFRPLHSGMIYAIRN